MMPWHLAFLQGCIGFSKGWFTKHCRASHGIGLWRGIMNANDFFLRRLKFKIGRGDRISFWEDTWVRDGPLLNAFPSLFEISRLKSGVVSDFYTVSNGAIVRIFI